MAIITRTLKSGKTLDITCEGTLLTAMVDGVKVSSGGLTPIPQQLVKAASGFAKMACGNVPVTADEAHKLKSAINKGKAMIKKKMADAREYNDLMNEGGEGYTPHAY